MLEIIDLTVTVGAARILDSVSLSVPTGRITAIVGGSGSGKTTLGMAILKLLPQAMRHAGGRIVFDKEDLEGLGVQAMRQIRGRHIGMVFQEPLSAFDPLFTIGSQLEETLAAHLPVTSQQRRSRALEALRDVEIEIPLRVWQSYPHQLSGGLLQRAMIAQALVCSPKLIIADEPTSSLDVTVQAKIIRLLAKINRERGVTILLIAHDLGLVGFLAHEAVVMLAGRMVEQGSVEEIMEHPQHEHTKALLRAY